MSQLIRVDFDQLKKGASELGQQEETYRQRYQVLEEKVAEVTNGQWEGDVGQAFKETFANYAEVFVGVSTFLTVSQNYIQEYATKLGAEQENLASELRSLL